MHIHWGKTLDAFENQYNSSLNMRILTRLLFFCILIIPEAIFQARAFKFNTMIHFTGFDEIRYQYWKKALEIWLNLKMNKNDNTLNIDEVDDIAMQPLWKNELVQCKGKSLSYKKWI